MDALFRGLSLAHSPAKGRRASLGSCAATPAERRKSSVRLPDSHPVSPASSDGGSGGSPGATPKLRQRSPTSPPATSHFSIAAYRGGSVTPASAGAASLGRTPASALPPRAPTTALPTVVEERITLNLFVQDASPRQEAAAEEAAALRQELQGLRTQLAAAQAAAAASAAAQQQQQQAAPGDPSNVALVVNVADAAPAVTPEAAVQLVLNVVEPAAPISPAAADGSSRAAAVLRQQLTRAEACREELARQAGQLKGRIAKVHGRWQRACRTQCTASCLPLALFLPVPT